MLSLKALTLLALGCCCALAGEYAVLTTGFRIHADRHEFDGDRLRLYLNGGVTELPAESIAGFEPEEYVPPAPAEPNAASRKVEASAQQLVEAAAKKYGLPPTFVHSVVAAESGYRSGAISPKGAIGLMQLMPATAQARGADPYIPDQNVEAGVSYLRELLLKYKGDPELALAAYNAGPGVVERYAGTPPYRETQQYIQRVLRNYHKLEK